MFSTPGIVRSEVKRQLRIQTCSAGRFSSLRLLFQNCAFAKEESIAVESPSSRWASIFRIRLQGWWSRRALASSPAKVRKWREGDDLSGRLMARSRPTFRGVKTCGSSAYQPGSSRLCDIAGRAQVPSLGARCGHTSPQGDHRQLRFSSLWTASRWRRRPNHPERKCGIPASSGLDGL